MKDNRKTIQVLVILTIIFTIMGGSLAYWQWTTDTNQSTMVTFKTNADFSCSADGGGNITNDDVNLVPTTCTDSEYAAANPTVTPRVIKRDVTSYIEIKKSGIDVKLNLWLKVNILDSGVAASDNFRYVLTTSSNSCSEGTILSSGNFKGKSAGDTVDILNNKVYSSTTTDKYYLYIWLDKEETSSSTMNQKFNFSLGGECTDTPQPEKPVLDTNGMIPVKIDENGDVFTVSSYDASWYNYENKEWANAVLVSNNRSTYLNNLSNNVQVDEDDILAYYVWIPRYKYRIPPTSDGQNTPRTIDIEFESVNDSLSRGDAVNTYYTHPAFTWDGEAVSGIWVGKFETTPDKSDACYTTSSLANCNDTTQNPTILPNEAPLVYQYIGNQFATSQNFTKSGNVYGLSNGTTDGHMMKNSEWGAVAYLSHSTYGINKEITINNYYNSSDKYYKTGCGALEGVTSTSNTCTNAYSTDGLTTYPQSTTGNITGIFDMSGGISEYVMGNYNNTTNTYFSTLPDSKYYDVYLAEQFSGDYTSNMSLCTLETCGGHALLETTGWYNDNTGFVFSSSLCSWFTRGSIASGGSSAGAFAIGCFHGDNDYSISWRSVLVVME